MHPGGNQHSAEATCRTREKRQERRVERGGFVLRAGSSEGWEAE